MSKKRPTFERFMEKVDKNGPNGCWNFTSSINSMGRGCFSYQGKRRTAHRVGYELMVRLLKPDEILHHKCENPLCVNPDHLQVTNKKEHNNELSPNHIGYRAKRRTHCPKGHPLAEPNLVKHKLPYRQCRLCTTESNRRASERYRKKDTKAYNERLRIWSANKRAKKRMERERLNLDVRD